MQRQPVDQLDATRTYWAPAVVAPRRDWAGSPGCRKGARFLVDADRCRATREQVPLFDSKGECLEWMMLHRGELAQSLPGARVAPVNLARWMLGLD